MNLSPAGWLFMLLQPTANRYVERESFGKKDGSQMEPVIEVQNLTRKFDDLVAVIKNLIS